MNARPDPALYPRLARLLQRDGQALAAHALGRLAALPGAAALRPGLDRAAELILAVGTLGPGGPAPAPGPVPRLQGPVIVDEGLRPLLGELARHVLEAGRPGDALGLFRLVAALSPGQAAGHVGLAMVWLSLGRADEAVEAAREALRIQPDEPAAVAALTEALVFAGRAAEARALLARVRGASGATAGWLRLLRVGLQEGWLEELAS